VRNFVNRKRGWALGRPKGRDGSRSVPYDSRGEFRHHSAAQSAPQEIWYEGIYLWRFGGALPGGPGSSPQSFPMT
jgi:hypothetical protein